MVTWLSLFEVANAIIQEAERNMGGPIAWTIGGGTMLYRRYAHRESKDIDIFVSDAQALSAFSPRLNDVAAQYAASRSDSYVEQSNFIKLMLGDGEVDFIVAPHLMSPYATTEFLGSTAAMVETPAEILAKKVFYRASSFTARDAFDLAFLIEQGVATDLVGSDAAMYVPKLEIILRRLNADAGPIREAFGAISGVGYTPSYDQCAAVIATFVHSCAGAPRQ